MTSHFPTTNRRLHKPRPYTFCANRTPTSTVRGNPRRINGNGTIFADGGFRPFGADFAEAVQVQGSTESYGPGDLLVIDASAERRLSKSQIPYSTLVAGIYSTQPGVVASQRRWRGSGQQRGSAGGGRNRPVQGQHREWAD
jgi:hypothetical protein